MEVDLPPLGTNNAGSSTKATAAASATTASTKHLVSVEVTTDIGAAVELTTTASASGRGRSKKKQGERIDRPAATASSSPLPPPPPSTSFDSTSPLLSAATTRSPSPLTRYETLSIECCPSSSSLFRHLEGEEDTDTATRLEGEREERLVHNGQKTTLVKPSPRSSSLAFVQNLIVGSQTQQLGSNEQRSGGRSSSGSTSEEGKSSSYPNIFSSSDNTLFTPLLLSEDDEEQQVVVPEEDKKTNISGSRQSSLTGGEAEAGGGAAGVGSSVGGASGGGGSNVTSAAAIEAATSAASDVLNDTTSNNERKEDSYNMETDLNEENNINNNDSSSNTTMLGRLCTLLGLRRVSNCILSIQTVADVLPSIPSLIVTNGKIVAMAFMGGYVALVLLWFPFWLLSFLIMEEGVYLLMIGTVFLVGRCIVRLIAFPGSSHRVYGEIESEFARYSIRMLHAASQSLIDVSSAVLSTTAGNGGTKNAPTKSERIMGTNSNVSPYEIPALWKRTRSYRDRVLGMYSDVLLCLIDEDGGGGGGGPGGSSAAEGGGSSSLNTSSSTSSSFSELTQHGNNRLVGDIGNLSNLTPQARSDGKVLSSLLLRVLSDLNALEQTASSVLNSSLRFMSTKVASDEAVNAAQTLLLSATELRDVLSSFKPPSPSSSHASPTPSEIESDTDDEGDGGGDDADSAAVRRRLQRQSTGSLEQIKSGAASLLPMIDPPPHGSIFGFDVLRGCMLSRYRGARQLWVRRPAGGMLDVLHLPALPAPNNGGEHNDNNGQPAHRGGGKKKKAVVYCNPNAGLIEVATGMSLIGGNVTSSANNENGSSSNGDSSGSDTCWTEFYIDNGYDVYLFNYAGFGRSYGTTVCAASGGGNTTKHYVSGCCGRLGRIVRSTFLTFKPTPTTLRNDALAVAQHVANDPTYDTLVLHGESIGGMAAAGAARQLSIAAGSNTNGSRGANNKLSLLICDRTFCNLEAVAQRLVGGWTGTAMKILTPLWNTNVAADFMSTSCPKVVANDPADGIIHDAASLRAGLAYSHEMNWGRDCRWDVGWIVEAPMEYRMADWEGVGVTESKFAKQSRSSIQAPIWPADKHISLREAFHFAACTRRIGKVATATKKKKVLSTMDSTTSADDGGGVGEGIEVSDLEESLLLKPDDEDEDDSTPLNIGDDDDDDALVEAWNALACCDGLCGAPLGAAVKEGCDCTVSWLCSTVAFGGQIVADAAERRKMMQQSSSKGLSSSSGAGKQTEGVFGSTNSVGGEEVSILPADFDTRPENYEQEEDDMHVHPIPLPEVISRLKKHLSSSSGGNIKSVELELRYCLSMLEYIVSRLESKPVTAASLNRRHFRDVPSLSSNNNGELSSSFSSGVMLNLHCGHNSQYSEEEREKLRGLLNEACGNSNAPV